MNMDALLFNDDQSLSLTIWGVTIAILFLIMLPGMYRNFKFLRASLGNKRDPDK